MLQLSSVRGKLSWPVVLVALLFLLAAAAAVLGLWPARRQAAELSSQISMLEGREEQLLLAIGERSTLERRQQELQESLEVWAKTLPTQYDLPRVLQALDDLASSFGFTMQALEHVPLALKAGVQTGIFSLSLQLETDDTVPGYLAQLQGIFPSLHLKQVVLGYLGENRYALALQGDLEVVIVQPGAALGWEPPQVEREGTARLAAGAFGVAFERVGAFINGGVQLLGIVDMVDSRMALIAHDGEKRWVKQGDRLGSAVVTGISPNTVLLDVDGVQLKLTLGG
ncbi:MAG: hypothetical protein QM393_00120 [Bacillota bacterium]|nr:hypothetical protein [Bacillota bacterium]